MPAPSISSNDDLARYQELLRESAQLRGTSLARRAWQKLRRQWPAMTALGILAVVVLLALLTPLLPLQPPRAVRLSSQYLPPQFGWGHPLFVESTGVPVSLDHTDAAELMAVGFGLPRAGAAATSEELGPLAAWLLRTRVRLWGAWSLNSLCGTDSLGRDLLSRICWGTRVSLLAATVATGVSLLIGVLYGAVAGLAGGWLDNLLMRIVDVLYSIPIIFVAIFLISILEAPNYRADLAKWGISRMTIFYLVIGALYWLTMARVVRGQVLSLKQQQFVEAAHALGAGPWWIIRKHLLPNCLSVVIVYLTLTIPNVLLTEAFLSFLGLGVQPPDVSWGLLANEGVKTINPIQIYWWLVLFPAVAIGLTLYSLNFLGDGLRDALDPRLRKLTIKN
ncbi:MAG: ABC transporter permease [Pirellulales bacterium]|nr:ABC transporter permease [Pirellulales bacterium]